LMTRSYRQVTAFRISKMSKVLPVILALIPFAAVVGACVSCP
jgi:hypothetical protein